MPAIITRGAASAKAFGWSGKTGPVTGQQAYIVAGVYSWVAPAGVTKVSAVAVGGGSGGGGALVYSNNKTVVPGNSYSVTVGALGLPGVTGGTASNYAGICAGASAGGGSYPFGGTRTGGTGGGNGGANNYGGSGGGGAGGYAGNGGNGGFTTDGTAGAGGGGGGGGSGGFCSSPVCIKYRAGGGGGVGILGQGTNGAAGTGGYNVNGGGGGGGSGGSAGDTGLTVSASGVGGAYGGGGGTGARLYGCCFLCVTVYPACGAVGAVRIIWPGCARSFPSTRTGNE